jgi:hypothetical protein
VPDDHPRLAIALHDGGRHRAQRSLAGLDLVGLTLHRPYMFGTPGLAVKSSISSLSNTPVPLAVTRAPNQSFSV